MGRMELKYGALVLPRIRLQEVFSKTIRKTVWIAVKGCPRTAGSKVTDTVLFGAMVFGGMAKSRTLLTLTCSAPGGRAARVSTTLDGVAMRMEVIETSGD